MAIGADFLITFGANTEPLISEVQRAVQRLQALASEAQRGVGNFSPQQIASQPQQFGSPAPSQAPTQFGREITSFYDQLNQGIAAQASATADPTRLAALRDAQLAVAQIQERLPQVISDFKRQFVDPFTNVQSTYNTARATGQQLISGATSEQQRHDADYQAAQALAIQEARKAQVAQAAAEARALEERRAQVQAAVAAGPGSAIYEKAAEPSHTLADAELSRQEIQSFNSLIKNQDYLSAEWASLREVVAQEAVEYSRVVATDRININAKKLADEELLQLEGQQKALYTELNAEIEARAKTQLATTPQYAANLATGQVADERIGADVAAQRNAALARDTAYLNNLGSARANEITIEAEKNARSTAQLSVDAAYLAAKSEGTINQAQIDEVTRLRVLQERAGLTLSEESKAAQLEMTSAERRSAIAILEKTTADQERVAVSRQLLGSDRESVLAAAELTLNQRLYATAVRKATQELAANSDLFAGGSLVQRAQAVIRQRESGLPVDPESLPTGPQLIGQSALTTARFAVSGAALYGGYQLFSTELRQVSEFEASLAPVKQQLEAIGKGDQFSGLRSALLDISGETGQSAASLATLSTRFIALSQDSHAAEGQLRAIAQIAAISGTDLNTVAEAAQSAEKNFGISARQLGDLGVQTQNAFGTPVKETLSFFGLVSPVLANFNVTAKEATALAGGLTSQSPSKSGSAEAESVSRIFEDIYAHQAKLVAFNDGLTHPLFDSKKLVSGDFGTVYKQILENYGQLNESQQKIFVIDATSSRNQPQLTAALADRVQQLNFLNNATTTQGSLESAFAARQDTLKQKLAEVSAEFTKLTAGFYNAGLGTALKDLAGIVEAVVSLGNGLGGLVNALGPLKEIGVIVAGIYASQKVGSFLAPIAQDIAGQQTASGAVARGVGIKATVSSAAATEQSAIDEQIAGQKAEQLKAQQTLTAGAAEQSARQVSAQQAASLIDEQIAATKAEQLQAQEARYSSGTVIQPELFSAEQQQGINQQAELNAALARQTALQDRLGEITGGEITLTEQGLAEYHAINEALAATSVEIEALRGAVAERATQLVLPLTTSTGTSVASGVETAAAAEGASQQAQLVALYQRRKVLEDQLVALGSAEVGESQAIIDARAGTLVAIKAVNAKIDSTAVLGADSLAAAGTAEGAIAANIKTLNIKYAERDALAVKMNETLGEELGGVQKSAEELAAQNQEWLQVNVEIRSLQLAIAQMATAVKLAAEKVAAGGNAAALGGEAAGAAAGAAAEKARSGRGAGIGEEIGVIGGGAVLFGAGRGGGAAPGAAEEPFLGGGGNSGPLIPGEAELPAIVASSPKIGLGQAAIALFVEQTVVGYLKSHGFIGHNEINRREVDAQDASLNAPDLKLLIDKESKDLGYSQDATTQGYSGKYTAKLGPIALFDGTRPSSEQLLRTENVKQYRQKIADNDRAVIDDLVKSGEISQQMVDDAKKHGPGGDDYTKNEALLNKLKRLPGVDPQLAQKAEADQRARYLGLNPKDLQSAGDETAQALITAQNQQIDSVSNIVSQYGSGDINLQGAVTGIKAKITELQGYAKTGNSDLYAAEIKKDQDEIRNIIVQSITAEVTTYETALKGGDISLATFTARINAEIAKLKSPDAGGEAKNAAQIAALNKTLANDTSAAYAAQYRQQADNIKELGGPNSDKQALDVYLAAVNDAHINSTDRATFLHDALAAEKAGFDAYVAGLPNKAAKFAALKAGMKLPAGLVRALIDEEISTNVAYSNLIDQLTTVVAGGRDHAIELVASIAATTGQAIPQIVESVIGPMRQLALEAIAADNKIIAGAQAIANATNAIIGGMNAAASAGLRVQADALNGVGPQASPAASVKLLQDTARLNQLNSVFNAAAATPITPFVPTRIQGTPQQIGSAGGGGGGGPKESKNDPAQDAKELRDAQNALFKAQYSFDPVKLAQADQQLADQHIADAALEVDGVKKQADLIKGLAERYTADTKLKEAFSTLQQADLSFFQVVAKEHGDLVAAAKEGVGIAYTKLLYIIAEDQGQANAAHDPRFQQAKGELLTAQNAVTDAYANLAQAQLSLLQSQASAAGDTVGAASRALQLAYAKVLQIVQKEGASAVKDPAYLQAQAQVATATRAVYDAQLQDKEDTIAFNLSVKNISSAAALAQYETLLANADALHETLKQREDLRKKIFDLKQSLTANLQFDLPSDLVLPTLYQARRFDQTGGNFQDNRVITITLNANSKLDGQAAVGQIVDAVNSPSRYGTRPRAY